VSTRISGGAGTRQSACWPTPRSSGAPTAGHYHARPAALWAGSIAHARIAFQLAETPGVVASCLDPNKDCVERIVEPAGFQWTDAGVSWELTDWEPDSDFRLVLRCCGPPSEGAERRSSWRLQGTSVDNHESGTVRAC
jgi:hypothetical protein